MNRIPVTSSQLESIGYDHETEVLEVQFNGGSVYQYDGVPQKVYDTLMTGNEGIGSRFNSLIKRGGYSFRKVSG